MPVAERVTGSSVGTELSTGLERAGVPPVRRDEVRQSVGEAVTSVALLGV